MSYHDEALETTVKSEQPQYDDLLQLEARAWGNTRPDPSNPQIWHDDRLFELFFGEEYRWLMARAVANGPHVLELGCGEGGLSIALAKQGCRVTGLDLSEDRISRARAKAGEAGLSDRTVFSVADLNRTTLLGNAYTCVVAHDSLHHILDLERLFSEVGKALKPGGVFVVLDYCGMGPIRRIVAAGLTAILPTYQSYAMKWQSRKHLKSFLAGEDSKRNAISRGDSSALHSESPFEGVSQISLIQKLGEAFETVRLKTFLPFWFYLAPKVRSGKRLRPALGKVFRTLDNGLSILGARGAYFTFEGRVS